MTCTVTSFLLIYIIFRGVAATAIKGTWMRSGRAYFICIVNAECSTILRCHLLQFLFVNDILDLILKCELKERKNSLSTLFTLQLLILINHIRDFILTRTFLTIFLFFFLQALEGDLNHVSSFMENIIFCFGHDYFQFGGFSQKQIHLPFERWCLFLDIVNVV